MKWVTDKTGRFSERPHYAQGELDIDCEEITHSILRTRNNGALRFPITTDELTVMIEKSGADLDLYADLSSYGANVEAVTEFAYSKKPLVKISSLLSEDPRMKNRLRTTLTHECGHVRFHRFLWDMKAANEYLFSGDHNAAQVCKREKIVSAGTHDWMEWQAGYCCGALLMPISDLRSTCHEFMMRQGTGPFPINQVAPEAEALIQCIASEYEVSRDAARVRLIQMGRLSNDEAGLQGPLWG